MTKNFRRGLLFLTSLLGLNQRRRVLVFLLLTATLFLSAPVQAQSSCEKNEVGRIDFRVYWSAFQVLQGGGNPYNKELVYQVQRQLCTVHRDMPLLFWNPPWFLPILSPFLWWDFETAVPLWFAANILFLFFAVLLTWKAVRPERPPRIGDLLLFSVFLPTFCALYFGQLGIAIGASLALFLWAIKNNRDALAGFSLALPSTKPHLLFLFWIALLVWTWRERRWLPLAVLSATVIAFTGITLFFAPDALHSWLTGFDPIYVHTRSASAVMLLRALAPENTQLTVFSMIVLPLASVIAYSAWLLLKKNALVWEELLPPTLCLSLLLTPYSWLHDQALLILVPVIVHLKYGAAGGETGLQKTRLMAGGLQIITFLFAIMKAPGQHLYVWFPAAMLLLWYTAQRQDSQA